MRAFVVGLLGTLVLAGTGAAAQPLGEGRECRPPVASPAGYQDCRTRTVADQTVCRCRVVPGLDLTRRSGVEEAVSAVAPALRPQTGSGAAVSLH